MSNNTAYQSINSFKDFLASKNLAKSTCQNYAWEARKFTRFAKNKKITPELLQMYRAEELKRNSITAVQLSVTGVNKYMEFIGCPHRMERIAPSQTKAQSERSEKEPLSNEEYLQILNAVKRSDDERLYLIVQSIGSAGLKLSELQQLTVEAAKDGKIVFDYDRIVYLPKNLCEDLLEYCRKNNIFRGTIITTRCGNVPNKANVSRAIKTACKGTGIDSDRLSTRAIRQFYFNSFENLRSEMVDIMDEERRNSRNLFFAKTSENLLDFYSERYFESVKDSMKFSVYDGFSHIYSEYIKPVLGGLDCRRLTSIRVEPLREKIEELPIRTQANILRVLQLVLDFAEGHGCNIRVNMQNLTSVGEMRILANDELDTLTACFKQSGNRIDKGIYLSLNTGIKLDELCALKCGDFDFPNGFLKVGCGNKRKIYLPQFLISELQNIYGNLALDDLIVPAKFDGKTEIENRFLDICEQCKIGNANFSVLRDTYGAMCAESGMKIDVMCEIMGISANECERYFPKNTEENQSPLEFLREAY